MTTKTPKPLPEHLSAEAQELYRAIRDGWDLDPAAEAVLLAGCEALDRMRQAQEAIAKDGAYTPGRFGVKAHPALAVERDSRVALFRAFRELDLQAPDVAEVWRR